jgi:hypothetical protein
MLVTASRIRWVIFFILFIQDIHSSAGFSQPFYLFFHVFPQVWGNFMIKSKNTEVEKQRKDDHAYVIDFGHAEVCYDKAELDKELVLLNEKLMLKDDSVNQRQ